jgi:hypothetical protein
MNTLEIDLDALFQLRVVVARFGEMDSANWWNTKGQLGHYGVAALRRGFPRTHWFAQARSVFAVAAHRCDEVFNPPGCATLWRLPEAIEEDFDTRWEQWLDNASDWAPFFEQIKQVNDTNLAQLLYGMRLVDDQDLDRLARLRRSAEGRTVALPGLFSGSDEDVRLLALGFARGEPGALTVPYARRVEA